MLSDLSNTEQIEEMIREVDHTIRLWDFTIPGLQRFEREFDFDSQGFSLSIVDPFNGIIPNLMSYDTLNGKMPPHLYPSVILDSNVMANLNQFVMSPNKLSENKRKVIEKFLDYLILQKVDYNPGFYYIESFSKAKSKDYERPILEYTKSILSLHSMDELHFLKKREIKPDISSIKQYSQKFGTEDLDEMAWRQFTYMREHFVSNRDWKILYLVTLKAALIHKTSPVDLRSKMIQLYEYLYNLFGELFSRELAVAAFYFSGKLDKFISLQKGANYNMLLNRFRATAWDLYLLRMPENMLGKENSPIPLAVICTGDKSVKYIGRKFRIPKLLTRDDYATPEIMIDFSDINDNSIRKGVNILDLFNEFGANREKRRKQYNVEEVIDKVENIISDLEEEIFEYLN